MAKVVDKGLPLHRINIVSADDQALANVHLKNLDLDGSSAAELFQPGPKMTLPLVL